MKANQPLVPPMVVAAGRPMGRAKVAFGGRFFVLLLLGFAWLGPGWWYKDFLYGMILWDIGSVLAWLWDLRGLPRPNRLELSRVWTAPLALETTSDVCLKLRNHGDADVSAEVMDEVPHTLRSQLPCLEIQVPAQGEAETQYSIRPLCRGDAKLGKAYIHYQSRLGLAEYWACVPIEQTVRVYPQLEEAKRYTLYLTRSRQVEMERRLARERGHGREFESLREYRQGDEWRDICWTATARRAKLVTKVYQAERSQAVWIVLDAGRLLCAQAAARSKLDCAVDAGLGLAEVALYSGDRVGLLTYGRRLQHVLNTGRGTPHLRVIVEHLAQVNGERLEADHMCAAETLLATQKQRSLVVWLTDLPESATMPEVVETALKMTTRHLVLLVIIGQQELADLAAERPSDARRMYRISAAQQIVQRRELLLRDLRQRGVLAIEAMPQRLSTTVVNQYLEIKERGLI